MATDVMQQRQSSLQSSILFMQQEHANTLKGLHEEIHKLQKKCSELTFQLAMETTSTSQEDFYRERSESLEKDLKEKMKMLAEKEESLEERNKKVRFLEKQLKAQEDKYKTDMKAKVNENNGLRRDLDSKATTIVDLMTKLQTHKRNAIMQQETLYREQSSVSNSSSDSSARVPAPPKGGAPRHRRPRGSSARSKDADVDRNTILQKPAIARAPSGRRLPERPDGAEPVPDPAPFLSKQHETADSIYIPKTRQHMPLPPIAQSSHGAPGVNVRKQYVALHQKYANHRVQYKKDTSPPSSSPEIETLAIEQVGQEPSLREADHYHSTE